MSLQDFNQVLVIILLIVLIIGIGMLVTQLTRTLKTLTLILEDTHNVTEKISDFSDHPEKLQQAAQRYVNESIDNVVTEQTQKLRKSIARDFLGVVIDHLRSSN